MTRREPFSAVLADMDGVLTRTAVLHERAWTELFRDYLEKRSREDEKDYGTFTSDDYRTHVDGKPRYDGVRDFLESRQISLPFGDPSDDSARETICGLGNRKNQYFLKLLDSQGVEVFEDALTAFARWHRGGLPVAVISSSRNCRRVLETANLMGKVDDVVDGQTASELNLQGKRDILLEASRRLHVEPRDAVVVEDATSGIRAARQGQFGMAVGISRDGNEDRLRKAGADPIVPRVDLAKFPRRLPPVLDRLEEWRRWQNGRPLAVFLDHDGTLAPIVSDPAEAYMPEKTRQAVQQLARRCPVSVISGRDRKDVMQRVNIEGLLYAGDHGLDSEGRGQRITLPEAEAALERVNSAEKQLRKDLQTIAGVIIERKRFSVAAHYRQVKSERAVQEVAQTVEKVQQATGLRKRSGKKVWELEPAVDWNKGRALTWLMEVMGLDREKYFAVYIGDDVTDEDAFAALQGHGAGVRVGDSVSDSLADYYLPDTDSVAPFLDWLAQQAQ